MNLIGGRSSCNACAVACVFVVDNLYGGILCLQGVGQSQAAGEVSKMWGWIWVEGLLVTKAISTSVPSRKFLGVVLQCVRCSLGLISTTCSSSEQHFVADFKLSLITCPPQTIYINKAFTIPERCFESSSGVDICTPARVATTLTTARPAQMSHTKAARFLGRFSGPFQVPAGHSSGSATMAKISDTRAGPPRHPSGPAGQF